MPELYKTNSSDFVPGKPLKRVKKYRGMILLFDDIEVRIAERLQLEPLANFTIDGRIIREPDVEIARELCRRINDEAQPERRRQQLPEVKVHWRKKSDNRRLAREQRKVAASRKSTMSEEPFHQKGLPL